MATKTESPIEGEVVEEIKVKVNRRSKSGIFFGTVFLVWGLSIILDTYFGTDLMRNLWPLIAIVFGGYLIASSF